MHVDWLKFTYFFSKKIHKFNRRRRIFNYISLDLPGVTAPELFAFLTKF